MNRHMDARPFLEVYITDAGRICVRQGYPDQHEDEYQAVVIDPEQGPLLMQWLQEVLTERAEMKDEDFKSGKI